MNILDRFTSIDELLVSLLERIGGVTEEDTHFFSYPNDGTRATITKGTTKLDFMAGTVMTPTGDVTDLGNSLRARGREYCRSLSLQADRDIIIQIGTKSKIPVFAGTWFKVAHLRFTDVKIITAEDTRIFVIACTNPDSIDMAGESYVKDPVDAWGKTTTIGNAEHAVRLHAPPLLFERRGDVLRWEDFESGTKHHRLSGSGATAVRTTHIAETGDFSLKVPMTLSTDDAAIHIATEDFHTSRIGLRAAFATDVNEYGFELEITHYDGVNYQTGIIEYRGIGGEIMIKKASGGYEIIATLLKGNNDYGFGTIKLVVDLKNGKYVRLLAFGAEYDISEYSLFTSTSAIRRNLVTKTEVFGINNTTVNVYVDNIIVTENEPES